MEVGHHQEAVLHLTGSKYLVYSPVDVTAPIKCGNTSEHRSTQAYIAKGIKEISVHAGCTAQLNDHQIIADSSIQIDSDIAHFAWNFSSLATEVSPEEIKYALKATTNSLHFSRLTLSDLMQNVREHRELVAALDEEAVRSRNFLISVTALAIACLAILYGFTNTGTGLFLRNRFRTTIADIRTHLRNLQANAPEPEAVLDAENPPQ
jgi:tyrosyl-tRNA synthetase